MVAFMNNRCDIMENGGVGLYRMYILTLECRCRESCFFLTASSLSLSFLYTVLSNSSLFIFSSPFCGSLT